MGGWNRRWHTRSHYGGSRGPSRPPPPPLPPHAGYNHENNQFPVPLWEREFCSYVGGISWQRFCENKSFVHMYKDIEQWDDSAAFENYENVKSRFWANYHGQPSDIPLPDPDMYIDRVDHRCSVDPELVAELDKVRIPFDADNEPRLSNTVANNNCAQNQAGNWDVHLEKPVAEVNEWEEDNTRSNFGWGIKHEPLNSWSKNSSGWEIKHEPLNSWSKNSSGGWGIKHEPSKNWSKNSSGWGDAPAAKPGWGSSSNNNQIPSNNWSSSAHGASNNAYKDPSCAYGRKRNGGGYSQQRNHQAEGSQRGRWHDHRGRNTIGRPDREQ